MKHGSGKYIPRVGDELLKLHLESSGAVLIEGRSGVERQHQLNNSLPVSLN